MAKIKTLLLLFCTVGFSSAVFAQQYITVDENLTIDQLVTDILVNNPCISVSNVSFTGLTTGSGSSIGRFTDGGSNFPFQEGIILSTGLAKSAVGPNSYILSEGNSSWFGDDDLVQALSVDGTVINSVNATVLEFDFLPLADKISFDYMFSSEQYLLNPQQFQCGFTDGFVFLLKKANTTEPYKNLAVIPNTNVPVKVNTVRGSGTVCNAINETYFGGFNGVNHPTNFNGQTVILTAKADVVPGTLYHIKMVIADEGNSQYDSAIFLGKDSFRIQKDLGEDRLISSGNPVCDKETISLNATEPGTSNTYAWYLDNVLQPEITALYTVSKPGIYRSEVTINGTACKITGQIEVEYASVILNQATIVQCDEDNNGITLFNLTKANSLISTDPDASEPVYYENKTDAQPIQNPEEYLSVAPKTIYAKVTNDFGCFAFIEVFLEISNTSVTAPAAIPICDEDDEKDGLYQFDLNADVTPSVLQGLPAGLIAEYYLNEDDALIGRNALSSPFENTTAFNQTIFAKILNGPDCYGITPVNLVVNALIIPDFDDEEVPLCEGSFVDVSVPAGYVDYQWDDVGNSKTSTLRVTEARTYNVIVTDTNGCTNTKKFIVTLSGIATITSVDITDFQGSANTVTINFTGKGSYEFSLDGKNYQTSPLFTNVLSGQYTVYVNDINKCGLATKTIFVLDYPKFFTPNNDGYNDVWRIPFLSFYPSSQVTIFDRYGKIVHAFSGNGFGWDGKLNSHPLPASDYWFVITLENGRTIKGHFALIR